MCVVSNFQYQKVVVCYNHKKVDKTNEIIAKTDETADKTDKIVDKTDEIIDNTDEIGQIADEIVVKTDEIVDETDEIVDETDETVDKCCQDILFLLGLVRSCPDNVQLQYVYTLLLLIPRHWTRWRRNGSRYCWRL